MSEIPKFLTKSSGIKKPSQKWKIIRHFNLNIHGIFSFVGNLINGNIFFEVLINWLLPQVKKFHCFHLQQDDASSCCHGKVSEHLSSTLIHWTTWCRRILQLVLLSPQITCPNMMLLLFWSVWRLTCVCVYTGMKAPTLASFVTIILAYGLQANVVINCMYECLFTHRERERVHVTWSILVIRSKK